MGSQDCLNNFFSNGEGFVLYDSEDRDILGKIIDGSFVANGCDAMREIFCAKGKDVVWTEQRGEVFIDEYRRELKSLYFCPAEYLGIFED